MAKRVGIDMEIYEAEAKIISQLHDNLMELSTNSGLTNGQFLQFLLAELLGLMILLDLKKDMVDLIQKSIVETYQAEYLDKKGR